MEVEENQIVLCTVEKILGTTVFVKIEGNGQGTITTSEIAPGRIRNLRAYVVPGKKIVCKVLNTKQGIHLSLRRVRASEKRELLNKIEKEKRYRAIIKTIIKDSKIIEKIEEDYNLIDFFEEIKTNPKLLEKYFKKQDSEKILKILESKKEKPKQIKQIISLSSKDSKGILIIKEILKDSCKKDCKVSYIAAGKYRLTFTGEDFKNLKSKSNEIIENIEKLADKNKCLFSIEKSK